METLHVGFKKMTREKYAFRMKLHPGKLAEYKKRHDGNWPELVVLLKNACILDYSIYLDEDTNSIFGVLWRKIPHRMAELPNHPVMKRWWAHMADIMDTHPSNESIAKPLLSMFHMDQ